MQDQSASALDGAVKITPTVLIERFIPRFQNGVAELVVGIQREEFGVSISLADQPELTNIPGVFQVGNGEFWCAVSDGRVVGTLGLIDFGDRRVALRKMFVAKEFRGRALGVSQRLLDCAESWARGRDVREIVLGTIHCYFAAHRFYEKNGFTRVEVDDLPAEFPRMAVDDWFYAKRL